MTPIVSVRGLTKRFGSVLALNNVDLDLHVGDVVGLIGQNGCGKSTLLKALAGLHEPDEGTIQVRGETVRLRSALRAAQYGIGMVHQEQSLIPNLKVAENIFLDKPNPAKRLGGYSWPTMYRAAKDQLAKIEIDIDPSLLAESFTFAERQMVELAKVLALEGTANANIVILFDEPTAVLAPAEIEMLFRQIRRLKSRAAIVFVSHRMDEILEICDRVVVMANCSKVAELKTADASREELYRLIVGHQEAAQAPKTNARAKAQYGKGPKLQVQSLSAPGKFENVSFSLRPGEILGFAGGLGSGAEELCRSLFGIEPPVSGTITLNGKAVSPQSPSAAIKAGFGYVPSDRKNEGALRGRTIAENMVLTYGLQYGFGNVLVNKSREEAVAAGWMARLKVKAPSANVRIETLSGGNQQKAVMGKWLMSKTLEVLLLDHPTRGLDPGARDDLYAALQEAADRGLGIIFIGDTIEEILQVSDSVICMRDGEITASFDLASGGVAEEDIVAAML